MRKIMLPLLATAALAFVLASPSIAADKPAAKTNHTTMKARPIGAPGLRRPSPEP